MAASTQSQERGPKAATNAEPVVRHDILVELFVPCGARYTSDALPRDILEEWEMSAFLVFGAESQSLGSRLLVAAVAPIVGGLMIGGAIQLVAWSAQGRQAARELRHELVRDMTEAASALYMATQLFWRVNTGRDPARQGDLAKLRRALDEQYLASRTAGLVLESRLEAYFEGDQARQRWHRTMDFLTVRYFQVLENDRGTDRAKRLNQIYRANAKPECTNVSEERLNDAQQVLKGFRQALSEASLFVLTNPLRGRTELEAALHAAAQRAEQRANDHPAEKESGDASDSVATQRSPS